MNREVHYDFTKQWAAVEGFSDDEAERIAAADWNCDVVHTGLLGKRYHWALWGAPVVAYRRYRRAVAMGDLASLGESLHCMQDIIAHGVVGHVFHWPGIDRWEHRSPRVRTRLEHCSRRMLASYRRKRA